MINILASVRRPFSGQILSGEKTWELRKNAPRLKKGGSVTLWLYESGKDGERAIIGKCRLVVTASLRPYPPKGILELVIEGACVTEQAAILEQTTKTCEDCMKTCVGCRYWSGWTGECTSSLSGHTWEEMDSEHPACDFFKPEEIEQEAENEDDA